MGRKPHPVDLLRVEIPAFGGVAAFARQGGWTHGAVSHWLVGRHAPGWRAALRIEELTAGRIPARAWLDAPKWSPRRSRAA